jgi:hypothetical protein
VLKPIRNLVLIQCARIVQILLLSGEFLQLQVHLIIKGRLELNKHLRDLYVVGWLLLNSSGVIYKSFVHFGSYDGDEEGLWLHCVRYTGPDWCYECPYPDWASLDNVSGKKMKPDVPPEN